jgi:alpha-beta hydrolase superfamily lysophospholipase
MQASTFTLATPDGVSLFVYRWLPDAPPKAVVQIAHGLAEHAARYARVAEALTCADYAVYADDHRGHGRTARTPDELGLFAERDGWKKCIDDLWLINRRIAADHPGVPIVLVGHSLGSFMVQYFISEHGDALAAAVLSASNGKAPPIAPIGLLLARLERLRLGQRGHSPVMQALFFGAFNKPFKPARTPFDWLSRDTAEVDKYIVDPLCGFESTVQLYIDLLEGLRETAQPSRQARISKDLPIYIFNGSRDPVSDNIAQLIDAYRAARIKQVVHKVYPDGRHESLNEANRDAVTRDLIAWLDGVIGQRRSATSSSG